MRPIDQVTDCDPQRCKSGGHECIFEESNRGKRSTRKNEALAAKISKMETALKSIGGVSWERLHSISSAPCSLAGCLQCSAHCDGLLCLVMKPPADASSPGTQPS